MDIMKKFSSWLVTLLVPVELVLFGVGVLLSPLYINVEYRLPYFPADPYGFTFEERLTWADLSIDYLLNSEEIDFLANLKFEDGIQAAGSCEDYLPPRDCSYLYNDRELSHMYDVKIVVRYAILVFLGSLLILIGVGIWAKKSNWWSEYRFALGRGGWLTVGLITAMLVYLVINFNNLFITFHEIFFRSGTWVFRFSDSLIRLFPVVFWRDAFIWVGVIALGSGAAMGYFLGRKRK
jgi:integral membrane protein (TIGR01906 family)